MRRIRFHGDGAGIGSRRVTGTGAANDCLRCCSSLEHQRRWKGTESGNGNSRRMDFRFTAGSCRNTTGYESDA